MSIREGTDDHEHCFCTQNTAGQPMCCQCGVVLAQQIIDRESFFITEQVKHEKRKKAESDGRPKN